MNDEEKTEVSLIINNLLPIDIANGLHCLLERENETLDFFRDKKDLESVEITLYNIAILIASINGYETSMEKLTKTE